MPGLGDGRRGGSPGSALMTSGRRGAGRAAAPRRTSTRTRRSCRCWLRCVDQPEGGGVPERGGAAVAEQDLVAVGQGEQLGEAVAQLGDHELHRRLAVAGAEVVGRRRRPARRRPRGGPWTGRSRSGRRAGRRSVGDGDVGEVRSRPPRLAATDPATAAESDRANPSRAAPARCAVADPRATLHAAGRLSRRVAAITPSATLAVDAKAKALKAAGRAGHRLRRRRARLRHPRPHRRGRRRRLPRPQEPPLHAGRAACPSCGGHRRQDPPRLGLRGRRRPGGRHQRRQARRLLRVHRPLVDPGDEVLLPAPYWTTYPEPIALAGGRAGGAADRRGHRLPGHRRPARGGPHRRAPRRSCSCRPRTRPGAVYPRDEIEAIGRWAVEHGIWVITDEIYEHLVYGDARAPLDPGRRARAGRPAASILNGVAKTYAMTGWRVGWMIGPADVVKARDQPPVPPRPRTSPTWPSGPRSPRSSGDLAAVERDAARSSTGGAAPCTVCSTTSPGCPAWSPRVPSTPIPNLDRAARRRPERSQRRQHARARRPDPRGGQGRLRARRGLRHRPATAASRSRSATTTSRRASTGSPVWSPVGRDHVGVRRAARRSVRFLGLSADAVAGSQRSDPVLGARHHT